MIRAVIFDWAGTIVDQGSRAPIAAIMELFAAHGISLTETEARADMGLAKKDHIRAICAGRSLDVEALYAEFVPRQLQVLNRYAELIPGVLPAINLMRSEGIKIGTTTGYTRPMLDLLLARAAEQGFRPDAAFCPDDTNGGRPAPWMCFANLKALNVYPPSHCVKIGDTPSDIEEGRNAGMWTIGVVDSGNEAGDPSRLKAAGADYLIRSVGDALPILAEINERLSAHPHHQIKSGQ